jgi:hypothetical protein
MTRRDVCRACRHIKASHNIITAADDDDPYTHKSSRGVCSEPSCVCKEYKE